MPLKHLNPNEGEKIGVRHLKLRVSPPGPESSNQGPQKQEATDRIKVGPEVMKAYFNINQVDQRVNAALECHTLLYCKWDRSSGSRHQLASVSVLFQTDRNSERQILDLDSYVIEADY